MNIRDSNWFQIDAYLEGDDRAVVPLGSTEQHAYLSLCVDSILAERVAQEAAAPLGVPVFPVVAYGLTPYFAAYPGTVGLRVDTYLRLLRDILDSLAATGFRRLLIVNGHGGNSAAAAFVSEWLADREGVRVKWHDWWRAPRTWATVQEIDPVASHASWLETFPWTRLAGVTPPDEQKGMADGARLRLMSPAEVRDYLGDGNMGGVYHKPDEVMERLWRVGVEETRAELEGVWQVPAPTGPAPARSVRE